MMSQSFAAQHTRSLVSRIMLLLVAVALLAIPLSGTPGAWAQGNEPLRVVATFSILADWVQQVGGVRIEVVTIIPPGGDAHGFDPSPDQVGQIADADLIFEIGAGFEPWLDDMVAASGSTAQRVVVSDGLDLISTTEDEHSEEATPGEDHAEHEEDEEHQHGEFDPHLWHDVANVIAIVEVIRMHLGSADSANAATFDANAKAYTAALTELDTYIRQETANVPEERRKLVASHDTFAYFARAYGFEVIGTALNSVTTESSDPPAGEIASLVEQITASGVPAIFAENVSNPDLMQSIADEAGVTLAPPLYTDALGEPGSDGADYISMMRYNTTTIVTALTAG